MPNLKNGLPLGKDIRVAFKKFGKEMVEQDFSMPDGSSDEFVLMRSKADPAAAIILPVTDDMKVIAIKQFRFGAAEVLYEIPGGNPKGIQTPEETLRDELIEETGYKAKTIVRLGGGAMYWFEPASVRARYVPFLSMSCELLKEPTPEKNEFLEVELIPVEEWFDMVQSGAVTDDKTVCVTMLALKHLGYKIVKI